MGNANSCVPECPKMDSNLKDKFLDPDGETIKGEKRKFWVHLEPKDIQKKKITLVGKNITYWTIPKLNDMKGIFPKVGSGLYMFMYTEKGLYLLKGIDHSPNINSFTDLKKSGGIEDWTLTAEEHGHSKGSIGHSSFFKKDDYHKQREIEKESEGMETEKSLQLKNENCKVFYGGELLYLIPEYTRKKDIINPKEDVGFIVYWNNHSGHFHPNNPICEKDFAKEYFPLQLFCQVGKDGEHNYKKQDSLLQSFVDIESKSLQAGLIKKKRKKSKKRRKSKRKKSKRRKSKRRKSKRRKSSRRRGR